MILDKCEKLLLIATICLTVLVGIKIVVAEEFLSGVEDVRNITWGTINGTYPEGFYDEENNNPNIKEDNDDDD